MKKRIGIISIGNKRTLIFIIFALLCLFLKIFFIIKSNPELRFYSDDQRNYEIANNYVQGKGYGIYDYKVRRYRLSAYHTSSTVFLYRFLIERHVPQKSIAVVFYVLSTILYLLAVFYFYRISQVLAIPRNIAYIATGTFALYPSVMYAIGVMYHFDNIVMPLHVVNFYYLLRWVKGRCLPAHTWIFLTASIVLCCFVRAQLLVLYFFTGCILLGVYIKNFKRTGRADHRIPVFWAAVAVATVLVYIPTLIKNKNMFNAYIISTQSGFEFLQGHNDIQKGKWVHPDPSTPLNVYVRSKVPFIDSLNEYEDSKVRSGIAWHWIKTHPGLEILYMFKKAARYFLPENSWSNIFGPLNPLFRFNPINIIVHLVFIVSVLMLFFKDRRFLFSKEVLLLSVPIVATIFLSVLYYFDFRLRYHAEPFIILLDSWFVMHLYALKKANANKNAVQNL